MHKTYKVAPAITLKADLAILDVCWDDLKKEIGNLYAEWLANNMSLNVLMEVEQAVKDVDFMVQAIKEEHALLV